MHQKDGTPLDDTEASKIKAMDIMKECMRHLTHSNPHLIIFSGLPGVGKSTLSEAIAEKLQIPIFSVDPIESSIIKSGITKSFETGYAAYLVAETLAAEQLRLGNSVIIDAVNAVKEARTMWYDLANKFGISIIIIECSLIAAIHKQRIESRTRNIYGMPEVSWEDVEKVQQTYLKWNAERLLIDTAQSLENNIHKILEYLNKKGIHDNVPSQPRKDWSEAFKSMHTNNEDKLLIDDSIDTDPS